jgi:ubiquinone/menaquinone biosynthesis C-methylase UbiE
MMTPGLYYDVFMWPLERVWSGRWRKELLNDLRGEVLEIGPGTGVNLKYYPPTVGCVTVIDPNSRMMAELHRKANGSGWGGDTGRCLRSEQGYGESLPFPEGSFDHVVMTLILCSVSDPARVVSEASRVLKDGGTLVMMEHQLPKGWHQAILFKAIAPFWALPSGCRLDRRTFDIIEDGPSLMVESSELRGALLGRPFLVSVLRKR